MAGRCWAPSGVPAVVRLVERLSVRLGVAPLALAVLLALTACGGVDRDASSAGASPEPTLFLAGEGALTVVDVNTQAAEVHPLAELAPAMRLPRRPPRERARHLRRRHLRCRLEPALVAAEARQLLVLHSLCEARPCLARGPRATSPETVRDLSEVREVSIDGRVTFPAVHPPGGRWPLAAVGEELVFEDRQGGLELWDRGHPRVHAQSPRCVARPDPGRPARLVRARRSRSPRPGRRDRSRPDRGPAARIRRLRLLERRVRTRQQLACHRRQRGREWDGALARSRRSRRRCHAAVDGSGVDPPTSSSPGRAPAIVSS